MKRLFILAAIAVIGFYPNELRAQEAPAMEQAVQEVIPLPRNLSRDVLVRTASNGTLLMTEDFEYTPGSNLNGLGGWNAHSGTGTNPPQITAGGLSYTGYVGSGIGNAVAFTTTGEDNNRPFATFPDGIASGSLYYALMVRLDSVAATGDYFFHLNKGATTFTARIFARRAANGNIRFGIGKSSTIGNIAFSDSIYTVGTTYLLAVKYTVIAGATNDTVALWVNPPIGGAEPEPTVLQSAADRATADLDTVYGVALRQGTASNAPIGRVDGIRVGSTWEDVVAGPSGGLTGTKTIGGTSPDYPTITAALADLQLQGVGTGGVTFRIRPGVYGTDPGIEADSVLFLGTYLGSGAGNPVRFVGEGSVIIERTGTSATSDYLLFLSGADYTEWDSITFRQRPGGTDVELGIAIQNASATNGSRNNTFKNFTIQLNTATNGNFGGGIAVFSSASAFPPTSQEGANDFNRFYNFNISGGGHGFQLVGHINYPDMGTEVGTVGGGSSTLAYGHNTLFNAGVGFGTQSGMKVFDVDIVSGTQAAAVSLYGIAAPFGSQGTSTAQIYGNRIRGLAHSGTGTGNNRAIAVINLGTYDIYNNVVSDISHATTSSAFVSAISIEGGPPVCRIFNNFVSDIKAPAGTGTTVPTIRGINAASGDFLGVYYNTVYLDAPNSAASRSSAALYVTATPTSVDYRNNILINKSVPGTGTTGRQAAFIKSSTALTNLDPASNNNLLYSGPVAGSTNKRAIFYPATGTGDTTLAQYKARFSPLESAAVTEDVAFVNTTTPPYDLHINATVPTRLESGGTNVTGITTDIDGDIRVVAAFVNSDVAPDIGADEFSGTPIDEIPPVISYTPLGHTTSTGDRQLTAAIRDLVSGVHEGPGYSPRMYYKKNGGSNWIGAQVDSTAVGVGNDWTFTISAANLGGLVIGDSVYYYVAAADSSGNVATNPAGGSGLPPGSTPPPTAGMFTVRSAVSGTMTIGASGATFTTVKAAFDSINASVVTGPVTLLINADYAGDAVFPIQLNEVTYAVGGPFPVTLRPNSGATPTISGSSATSVIRLNGADYVTIDGSNNGSSSRDLTIMNTATTANSAAIWLSSLGTGAGASNNTVMNCYIAAGANQNTTSTVTFGIITSGATITTTTDGADNDNNTFTNNVVIRARNGIFVRGAVGNPNSGTTISRNIVGPDAFGPDQIGVAGIVVQHQDNATITQNTVRYVGGPLASTTAGADRIGIGLGSTFWTPTTTVVTNSSVTRNLIHNIIEERTFSAVGIVVGGTGTPSNNIVANNMIHTVLANGTVTDQGVGIGIGAGNSDVVAFNSFNTAGDIDPTGTTTATQSLVGIRVSATTVTNLTLKNNISVVDVTSNTATLKHYSVVAPASYSWGTGGSNHNDFYVNTANAQMVLGGIGTTVPYTEVPTLAGWQGQFSPPQDLNSISEDPLFVSPTDLHIQAGLFSPVDSAGTPIAGIAEDFDGDARNATYPDIGADEFTRTAADPPAITSVSRSTRVPNAGDPITVSSTITDVLGVTSANLLYQINGGTAQSVPMTLTGGTPQNGTWQGVLPGSANANGNRIEYRIQATNSGGASSITNIVPANSYYAGITPLSLTGLRRMHPDGRIMDSTYYARVTGVVNGPNFQTTNLGYHFQDAVGGIQLFAFGINIPPLNLGDSIIVTGRLLQFRGLTEIVPDTQATDVQVVATGRPVPIIDLTVAQFLTNPELYESRLVRFNALERVRPTPPWPGAGISANITMFEAVPTDTIIMRVDSDTELPGTPEPTYPARTTGVITQFTSATSVYNDGYQTQPRYTTDFTTPLAGPLLFEDFEGAAFPPAGWSSYIVAGDSGWRVSTAAPYSGTRHAFNRYQSAGTMGSKFLVTRRVTLPSVRAAYELSFYMRRVFTSPFPPDTVYIKLSTTDSLPSSFGPAIYKCYTGPLADTATNPNIYGINYRRFSTTISGYSGPLFIAFDHQDNDGQTLYLDDVRLEELQVHDIGVIGLARTSEPNIQDAGPLETSRHVALEYSLKEQGTSLEMYTGEAPESGSRALQAGFVPASRGSSPLRLNSQGNVSLEAFVQNFGAFDEPTYQVGWSINGVAQTPVNNTNVLEVGDVDTVVLTWNTPTPGIHTARAWTILAGDANAANDTSAPLVFEILPPNIIFEEVFADTSIPAGWVVVNNDGSPAANSSWRYVPQINFTGGGQVNPQAGTRFWFASYTGANASGRIDEWLISPQIPAANFDSLYFYCGAIGGQFPDSIRVLVSTTDNQLGSFQAIAYFRVPGPVGSWNRFGFDLSPFDGENIYVAINYYIIDGGPTGTNSDNVWVDHVFITGTPVGPPGFFDNFDSYTAGQRLACQNPTDWTTWSLSPCNTTEDALISSAQSYSGPNSVVVVQNNDLVKPLGNDTTGVWRITFKVYIPTGRAGYFNTLATFSPPSTFSWAMQVYFDVGGGGRIFAGASTATNFTYTNNAWHTVEVLANLNADSGKFYFNSTLIRAWRWSAGTFGAGGPRRLAANNFYGATANDEMYFDDYHVHEVTVDVEDPIPGIPVAFDLAQNYPNPFNPTTTIRYALPTASLVTLTIYNVLGQEVATLADEVIPAGYHTVRWDGQSKSGGRVASGVYLYRIEARPLDGSNTFSVIRKMMLLK